MCHSLKSTHDRKKRKNVSSKIDTGLIRDEGGKLKVREDPAAEFAREWEKRKNIPPEIPDDPEYKGGELIKST